MAGSRRRTGNPSKGDLREQAILDAAERQIESAGPEGLTVETLATTAGITRGAFYFYFRSKDEVLAALVGRTVATLQAQVAATDPEADQEPAEALRAAVDRTERTWREHGALMRLAVDLAPANPVVREHWQAAIASTAATLTRVAVRAGLPDGPGPEEAPAIATALVWMTERTFYQATSTHETSTNAVDDDQLTIAAQTVTAVWTRALKLD